MNAQTVTRLAVHLASSLAAGAALATAPAAPDARLPEERQSGAVAWRSGGVGHEEAVAMIKAAKRYPLELVFVERQGQRDEYLAAVPLTIQDAKGHVVFSGQSEGPYFLARLPEGHYVVNTKWQEWSFTRAVDVGTENQRVVFQWKKDVLPANTQA